MFETLRVNYFSIAMATAIDGDVPRCVSRAIRICQDDLKAGIAGKTIGYLSIMIS